MTSRLDHSESQTLVTRNSCAIHPHGQSAAAALGVAPLLVTLLVASAFLPLAALAEDAVAPRVHFSDGIYVQGSALVTEGKAGGSTQQLADGWVLQQVLAGNQLALVRRADLQTQVRILNADGVETGKWAFPADHAVFISSEALVSSPMRKHHALTSHTIRFFSMSGSALAEVEEPGLALVSRNLVPGGFVITHNQGPEAGKLTVLIYRNDGTEHWRRVFASRDRTQSVSATITPDGNRIVSIKRIEIFEGTTEVTVFDAAGSVLARHDLGRVQQALTAPGGDSIALVGFDGVTLLSAEDGRVLWSTFLPLEYFSETSVRFSPSGDSLLLVSARFDRPNRVGTQYLWRLGSSDGASRRTTIAERSMSREFEVVDIAFDGDEPVRIIMRDGAIPIPAPSGGAQP